MIEILLGVMIAAMALLVLAVAAMAILAAVLLWRRAMMEPPEKPAEKPQEPDTHERRLVDGLNNLMNYGAQLRGRTGMTEDDDE